MSALNTDFKHRIEADPDGEFYNVTDALIGPLGRIAALAEMMEFAYSERPCHEYAMLSHFAETIRLEAMDGIALLDAYQAAENAANSKKQQA